MIATKTIAACIMLASETYGVPPALLAGIYRAEGGKVGQQVENTNGSFDLGPMQINTIWLPELSKKWKISPEAAHKRVRDNTCANVEIAAWILQKHLYETKSLSKALKHYHSRTSKYGEKYKKRVLKLMKENGLLKTNR